MRRFPCQRRKPKESRPRPYWVTHIAEILSRHDPDLNSVCHSFETTPQRPPRKHERGRHTPNESPRLNNENNVGGRNSDTEYKQQKQIRSNGRHRDEKGDNQIYDRQIIEVDDRRQDRERNIVIYGERDEIKDDRIIYGRQKIVLRDLRADDKGQQPTSGLGLKKYDHDGNVADETGEGSKQKGEWLNKRSRYETDRRNSHDIEVLRKIRRTEPGFAIVTVPEVPARQQRTPAVTVIPEKYYDYNSHSRGTEQTTGVGDELVVNTKTNQQFDYSHTMINTMLRPPSRAHTAQQIHDDGVNDARVSHARDFSGADGPLGHATGTSKSRGIYKHRGDHELIYEDAKQIGTTGNQEDAYAKAQSVTLRALEGDAKKTARTSNRSDEVRGSLNNHQAHYHMAKVCFGSSGDLPGFEKTMDGGLYTSSTVLGNYLKNNSATPLKTRSHYCGLEAAEQMEIIDLQPVTMEDHISKKADRDNAEAEMREANYHNNFEERRAIDVDEDVKATVNIRKVTTLKTLDVWSDNYGSDSHGETSNNGTPAADGTLMKIMAPLKPERRRQRHALVERQNTFDQNNSTGDGSFSYTQTFRILPVTKDMELDYKDAPAEHKSREEGGELMAKRSGKMLWVSHEGHCPIPNVRSNDEYQNHHYHHLRDAKQKELNESEKHDVNYPDILRSNSIKQATMDSDVTRTSYNKNSDNSHGWLKNDGANQSPLGKSLDKVTTSSIMADKDYTERQQETHKGYLECRATPSPHLLVILGHYQVPNSRPRFKPRAPVSEGTLQASCVDTERVVFHTTALVNEKCASPDTAVPLDVRDKDPHVTQPRPRKRRSVHGFTTHTPHTLDLEYGRALDQENHDVANGSQKMTSHMEPRERSERAAPVQGRFHSAGAADAAFWSQKSRRGGHLVEEDVEDGDSDGDVDGQELEDGDAGLSKPGNYKSGMSLGSLSAL